MVLHFSAAIFLGCVFLVLFVCFGSLVSLFFNMCTLVGPETEMIMVWGGGAKRLLPNPDSKPRFLNLLPIPHSKPQSLSLLPNPDEKPQFPNHLPNPDSKTPNLLPDPNSEPFLV